jgi:hypothetical protein
MGRIAAIHQPNFLPYPGVFHKFNVADRIIFLTDVEYTKGGFINRNKILTPQGVQWLTVPVQTKNNMIIQDVWIAEDLKKIEKTLHHNYSKAPFYDKVMNGPLRNIGDAGGYLWMFNTILILEILRYLNRQKDVYFSSDLNIEGKSTEKIINICRKVGCDTYISGLGAKKYLDTEAFRKNNIKLIFDNYKNMEYSQLWADMFVPDLSIVDMLFNCGSKKTVSLLRK